MIETHSSPPPLLVLSRDNVLLVLEINARGGEARPKLGGIKNPNNKIVNMLLS